MSPRSSKDADAALSSLARTLGRPHIACKRLFTSGRLRRCGRAFLKTICRDEVEKLPRPRHERASTACPVPTATPTNDESGQRSGLCVNMNDGEPRCPRLGCIDGSATGRHSAMKVAGRVSPQAFKGVIPLSGTRRGVQHRDPRGRRGPCLSSSPDATWSLRPPTAIATHAGEAGHGGDCRSAERECELSVNPAVSGWCPSWLCRGALPKIAPGRQAREGAECEWRHTFSPDASRNVAQEGFRRYG